MKKIKYQLGRRPILTTGLFLTLLLGIIVGLTFLLPNEANAEWFNDSWAYRKKITIDNTKVSGSTNFTDFPIAIIESADSGLSAYAQSDGDDIIFTDHAGRKLDHEIESYSAGTLAAWVKVPTLLATENTVIYMYYGNPSVSAQENPGAVWNS